MKDIKQYTCTFEQAKKLKEFGIKQDPIFGFYVIALEEEKAKIININEGIHFHTNEELDFLADEHSSYHEKIAAAFTSQELLEMINSIADTLEIRWSQEVKSKVELDDYNFRIEELIVLNIKSTSEAHARAALLIYLLRNK